MHPNDDFMQRRGDLSDRLNDGVPFGPVGGIEDLLVDSASQSHTYYGMPGRDRYVGEEALWPSYRPYEPELPPAARYEPPAPPPVFAPAPQPEQVRYEDGLMTQAFFDWSMRNLPETPPAPSDEWI